MQLNWHVNETATVLHVAASIACGFRLSDTRITRSVETSVGALREILTADVLPEGDVWAALCAHACQQPEVDAVVRAALPVADQPQAQARQQHARQERIVQLVGEVAVGIQHVLPGLGGELLHRSRPLREQWEARGPGLLRSLWECTDSKLRLEQASVSVVHPVLGGGGDIGPVGSTLWIEGLLANTVPGLPEVVRLGWLLARLAGQQASGPAPPVHQTHGRTQSPGAIALAMVPATLTAAETVELAVCNVESVRQAIAAWQHVPAVEPAQTAKLATLVWDWWQSRQADRVWEDQVGELAKRL